MPPDTLAHIVIYTQRFLSLDLFDAYTLDVQNAARPFSDRDAAALFEGRFARRLGADIQRVAQRKLRQIHQAEQLMDLAAPPVNRLELLKGRRAGQHSIRINDQWRICFVWRDGGAERVEIVDYHRG